MATVLIALVVLTVLGRLSMTLASFFPERASASGDFPSVLAIIAAHNEEATLPEFFESLDRLNYPASRLSFLFVDDGSTDESGRLLDDWCADRSAARVLHLAKNMGKGAALEAGRKSAAVCDLIVMYDADVRPDPDSLRSIVAPFADPRVGAASGPRLPSNSGASVVSRYAGLEQYVFDLVIQPARQALHWNPPVLGGNFAVRAAALDEIGGFARNTFSEDLETSFALHRKGWRTAYCVDARVYMRVPTSLAAFWRQRQRWTRGIYRSMPKSAGLGSLMTAAGYADRLIFLAALIAAAGGTLSFRWPLVYLIGPVLPICAALWRAKDPGWVWIVLACPPMFVIDVCSTVVGALRSVMPTDGRWKPERRE
jgi:cellulose synthase/poly-beta-1,6-N-acetylglucosamine synthase-like glycosyltransferase